MSMAEYLESCRSDPMKYANAAERLLAAIGEPQCHARVVTGRPATPALDRAIADRAAEARAITVATRAGRPEMR